MPSPSLVLLRSQSDARLVALARDGHERAFEAIVEPSLSRGIVGGGYERPDAHIVFATIASLARRLSTFLSTAVSTS